MSVSSTAKDMRKAKNELKKKCNDVELNVITHNIFVGLADIMSFDDDMHDQIKSVIYDAIKLYNKSTVIPKLDGKKLFYDDKKEEVGEQFEGKKGLEKSNAVRRVLKRKWDELGSDEQGEYEKKAKKKIKKDIKKLKEQMDTDEVVVLKVKGKRQPKEKKPRGKTPYNIWMSQRNKELKDEGMDDYSDRREKIKEEYKKITSGSDYAEWKKKFSVEKKSSDDESDDEPKEKKKPKSVKKPSESDDKPKEKKKSKSVKKKQSEKSESDDEPKEKTKTKSVKTKSTKKTKQTSDEPKEKKKTPTISDEEPKEKTVPTSEEPKKTVPTSEEPKENDSENEFDDA